MIHLECKVLPYRTLTVCFYDELKPSSLCCLSFILLLLHLAANHSTCRCAVPIKSGRIAFVMYSTKEKWICDIFRILALTWYWSIALVTFLEDTVNGCAVIADNLRVMWCTFQKILEKFTCLCPSPQVVMSPCFHTSPKVQVYLKPRKLQKKKCEISVVWPVEHDIM